MSANADRVAEEKDHAPFVLERTAQVGALDLEPGKGSAARWLVSFLILLADQLLDLDRRTRDLADDYGLLLLRERANGRRGKCGRRYEVDQARHLVPSVGSTGSASEQRTVWWQFCAASDAVCNCALRSLGNEETWRSIYAALEGICTRDGLGLDCLQHQEITEISESPSGLRSLHALRRKHQALLLVSETTSFGANCPERDHRPHLAMSNCANNELEFALYLALNIATVGTPIVMDPAIAKVRTWYFHSPFFLGWAAEHPSVRRSCHLASERYRQQQCRGHPFPW